MNYIKTTEVAKIARQRLGQEFPTVKFSVRSHEYANGASVRVSWTNGPTTDSVEKVVGDLEGSTFDPSQDLKTSNGRPYLNDYIFCDRHITEDIWEAEKAEIAKEFGLNLANFEAERVGDDWATTLVNRRLGKKPL